MEQMDKLSRNMHKRRASSWDIWIVSSHILNSVLRVSWWNKQNYRHNGI